MKDFTGFESIERLVQNITITEKIHGTNAQISVDGQEVTAGSRTRWITPKDDNFGFASFVEDNKLAIIEKLGDGQHFGEWYGSGINAGYGMKSKRFALFNTFRWSNAILDLPPGFDVVPILYTGPYMSTVVEDTFNSLKLSGSKLVPGYMKPEGIVVRFDRSKVLMKRTFEAEDAAWNYAKPKPERLMSSNDELCNQYWHPMRLEKLLSREEAYTLRYPETLPLLVKDYVADLLKEVEIDEVVQKAIKKGAFAAIKGMMLDKGYTS